MRKQWTKILLMVWILISVGAGAWYMFAWGNTTIEGNNNSAKSTAHTVDEAVVDEEPKEKYSTVSPTSLDDGQSLTLIWTVVSNEFATVYSRRSGIIKDLYIDIWDAVKENQTIWELLPPGDVGQSSANIFEKQVKVKEAKANLEFIQKVSKQMVGKASLDKNLQELDGDTASAEMIEKIETDIESSERELAQVQNKHREQLKKIEADLEQEKEQVTVMIQSIIQTLEHVMLWSDHSTTSISDDDLRRDLGVRNTATRREALDVYRRLTLSYQDNTYWSLDDLMQQMYDAIDVFLQVIEYSTTHTDLTQDMLEEFSQMLYTKQSNILNTQEMLEDIENLYTTTIESQAQETVMLENMIIKWEASLWEKTASLQNVFEKAEQQVDLVAAEQDLKVQQAKNKVEVAKASLNKEYASSGNEKIATPFGWTVSKRMVQVGDMVSMGMPLYELVDVPTSLSKKAKREVQFGLPEEYIHLISLGNSIQFSSAQSDMTLYDAEIHRISPQVDQMTKTVTVQATLPDEVNLPHNSRVNITLGMIQQQSYQIPASTIMYVDGETFIPLLSENDEIEMKAILVLADDGEFADVQWDIDESYKIVVNYIGAP